MCHFNRQTQDKAAVANKIARAILFTTKDSKLTAEEVAHHLLSARVSAQEAVSKHAIEDDVEDVLPNNEDEIFRTHLMSDEVEREDKARPKLSSSHLQSRMVSTL